MAAARDFILNDLEGDLKIINGDFVIGDSDSQHVRDIIADYPGYWKQYINVGVGLPSYQNGSISIPILKQTIKTQLINDGFNVQGLDITLTNGTLEIIPYVNR